MPAEVISPTVGYVAFCIVKLAGYTMAGSWLAKIYKQEVRAWKVGLSRTLLGMTVGAVIYVPVSAFGMFGYLVLLFPIRILEWWLIIWYFYFRRSDKPFDSPALIVGTIWSYVLDLPAIFGFLVTGGVYVC